MRVCFTVCMTKNTKPETIVREKNGVTITTRWNGNGTATIRLTKKKGV